MFLKQANISLFLIICFWGSSYSQVNLMQGLVAYYPFSGNAIDASGNNNNPIFNNATLTADRNGNANSAYHFNGLDNYMQISNSPSLNMNNTISICVWVKAKDFYTGTCYNNMLISKGITDNPGANIGNYNLRFADAITGCSSSPSITTQQFYSQDLTVRRCKACFLLYPS
jgi:hypothetical protein